MGFDETVNRQYALGNEIKQLIENCKKAPKERRTSQFYNSKIQRLQEFGDELYNNHQEILAAPDRQAEHVYFSSSYYNEVNKLVVEYTKTLERKALELANDVAGAEKSDQEEVTRLKKLLRNQKALMQALTKSIEEIERNRTQEHPQAYYSIQAAILEKHMVDLVQNNAAIWEATDEDQVDDYTLQTFYELEAKVGSALIELQQHINVEPSLSNTSTSAAPHTQGINVQLPRITLPKFNGEYLQWVTFKDLFTEIVHQASITDSQRMHYLSQSLVDEPKNLIRHLPSTGSNYLAAWNILVNRYDNKRLLVSSLLNKLMSQAAIKNESSVSMKALHDVTKECLHGLKTQGIPIQHWDAIIAHILLQKMDQPTQTAFEQSIEDSKRLVTQDEVLKFLERRFQSLEVRSNAEKTTKKTCGSIVNADGKCTMCKKDKHQAYDCQTFKKAPTKQKWRYVKDNKLCVNCLKPGHQANACKAKHCTKCTRKHNSLLHPEENRPESQPQSSSSLISTVAREEQLPEADATNAVSLLTNQASHEDNFVLLGTARIILVGENGNTVECKAVLDSGSQANLVTERLVKKLGISSRTSQLQLEGVGSKGTSARHRTTLKIQSKINDFATDFDAHILPKIVSDQPAYLVETDGWKIPKSCTLADPQFNKPGKIDCLIGAEKFFDLLTQGNIKLGNNRPTLQNTVFGWVVAGSVGTTVSPYATCGICTGSELETMISKFWELEEVPEEKTNFTEDELKCETHFMQTTTRAQDGRFMVKLPLKEHPSSVGDTRELAYYRMKHIEKRLSEDQALKAQYDAFMDEYESLGHMTEVNVKDIAKPHYYIPHHYVLRPESTSTKLRVVFDASAHRASNLSLNEIMHTGPTVQSELFSILLRFRTYRYVLKTDVEKMYRQIWVHPEHRNLQLIMWRKNPEDRVKTYQLNTVTYGTRAAPYLATRCLNQLAEDNMLKFPIGAQALKNNFYVDDGLVGANSLREASEIQQQLTLMLNSAGMKLKKWCANTPKVLSGIPTEDQEIALHFDAAEDQYTKTLGLTWMPKCDSLKIKAKMEAKKSTTKRSVTSDVARIYDPLGLVGPVIVTAKIFIQLLWQLKIDWDAELPTELQKQWNKFRDDLPALELARFPRHIFGQQEPLKVELHAFADASERAYGAAVYIRTIQKDKTIRVNLLCSKSRVAPLKLQTIPKLELCAALLAAEIVSRVKNDLGYQTVVTFYWSDSQIALSWINNHPGTLLPFVAHRVVKIRQLSAVNQWRHVPSKQNPADILSRGLKPTELPNSKMWFFGPLFLYQPENSWPQPVNIEEAVPIVVAASTMKLTPPKETSWIYAVSPKGSFLHVQKTVTLH